MAYKFQIGDALLGGALRQKGTITGEGIVSASTNLKIGSVSINQSELSFLDGVTAGTSAVSKALVLDSSGDIDASGLRHLTASGDLSASAFNVPKDGLLIAGATVNTRAGELNFLAGVTAGQAAASKAIVLDGSSDITSGINNLTIDGNLTVKGTTTTIESTNLGVKDSLIELNIVTGSEGRVSNSGAGLFISGSSTDKDATLTLAADGGRFKASGSSGGGFDIAIGGDYRINNTSVLTSTTLGSGVATSSLNEVGTLTAGAIGGGFTQIAVSGVVAINTLDIDGGVAIDSLASSDLIIVDDGAGGTNKKATIAQVATYIGSAGTKSTGYTLRTISQAGGTTFRMSGTSPTGLYGFENNHTASFNIDLSGSWSSGDLVIIKSNASGAAFPLTIRASGSNTIDGEASVVLESTFAAISLVYDGQSSWMII